MAQAEQFALCDVVLTEIKVSGGSTHSFSTADEISCEPVIEEGGKDARGCKIEHEVAVQYGIDRIEDYNNTFAPGNFKNLKLLAEKLQILTANS